MLQMQYTVVSIAGHRHRHPVFQSSFVAIRYRTGSPYSSTGLVPASEYLFIPVPDWLDAEQSDILAFKKAVFGVGERDPMHVQTAGSEKWYTLHVHRQLLMVLFLLYDIEKSYINAGMPEKS